MVELSTDNKSRKRWVLFVSAILPLAILLTACGGAKNLSANESSLELSSSDVQAEILKAPANVQTDYQFAITNPDALKNVPCYCGCGAVGHTSNYSCYVKEITSSGEVVYDAHALYCYLCVQINEDTQKLIKEGKTPAEIRAAIDAAYSQYGKSNMLPVK